MKNLYVEIENGHGTVKVVGDNEVIEVRLFRRNDGESEHIRTVKISWENENGVIREEDIVEMEEVKVGE